MGVKYVTQLCKSYKRSSRIRLVNYGMLSWPSLLLWSHEPVFQVFLHFEQMTVSPILKFTNSSLISFKKFQTLVATQLFQQTFFDWHFAPKPQHDRFHRNFVPILLSGWRLYSAKMYHWSMFKRPSVACGVCEVYLFISKSFQISFLLHILWYWKSLL